LILIGDWYKNPGEGWKVACYFLSEDSEVIRKGLPVDLLPALIPGSIYPRSSVENRSTGYSGTFKVPAMERWERCHYRDLPHSLKRMRKFSDEIDSQIIYRFDSGGRIMWLPAAELARMLFFHSAEVVRAAVYQGNTFQLAKSDKEGWIGEISFSSNIPVSYLNSLQFRKFFAWLLFDIAAEYSFCSIFRLLNEHYILQESHERWTFEFQPPDLSFCEISWTGYTGNEKYDEKHHCYIREIRSIAGLPSPELETIFFSHPDDDLILETEKKSESGHRTIKSEPKIEPTVIDTDNPPKSGRKRLLLNLASSGLHFDAELDLRRSPRHIKPLPTGESPDMNEPEIEEECSLTEMNDHGKVPRADVDNLEKPELIDAPEKMDFFQAMLEQLEKNHGWKKEINFGEVPQNNCRSAHLINGRYRKYCHVVIERDPDTSIQLLEIELKVEESLSTLLYRSKDIDSALTSILDALMTSDSQLKYKTMQWKRKINSDVTISRHYLEHPDKKIKNEADALETWVARAAEKIIRM
jgi:hypothetical protein